MQAKTSDLYLEWLILKLGTEPFTYARCLYNCSPSVKLIDDKHDDGDHKKYVNQSAADTPKHPQRPQHQQDRDDCPGHSMLTSFCWEPTFSTPSGY